MMTLGPLGRGVRMALALGHPAAAVKAIRPAHAEVVRCHAGDGACRAAGAHRAASCAARRGEHLGAAATRAVAAGIHTAEVGHPEGSRSQGGLEGRCKGYREAACRGRRGAPLPGRRGMAGHGGPWRPGAPQPPQPEGLRHQGQRAGPLGQWLQAPAAWLPCSLAPLVAPRAPAAPRPPPPCHRCRAPGCLYSLVRWGPF
mmetsp:Transcript_20278/g.56228  ORF Transcript_20278/g.56228 Transcript_20278/m.56228 type:complete len:200 (+) Transcript_20278:281-880(+)